MSLPKRTRKIIDVAFGELGTAVITIAVLGSLFGILGVSAVNASPAPEPSFTPVVMQPAPADALPHALQIQEGR